MRVTSSHQREEQKYFRGDMPVTCPLDAKELEKVAAEYGTPYQLYDETLIRDNARHLISKFKGAFPTFQQFFAVKALPNPAVLKLLIDEGTST